MVRCFNCGTEAEREKNRAFVAYCRNCQFVFAARTTARDEANGQAESTVGRRCVPSADLTAKSATLAGYALAEAQ
jgi:hypothetical protein